MKILLLAFLLAADISPPLPPPPPKIPGKIVFLDAARQQFAIDLRERDRVVVGLPLAVYRRGCRIGEVEIVDVQAWGSWARVRGETRFESLRKEDRVESPP